MKWWMPPVIGVGAVAVANVFLLAAVYQVRPGKVMEHPYAASAHEDERRAELHAFASRGWRLEAASDAGGATLRLLPGSGPAAAAASVHLYRPDDPGLDRDLAWSDPGGALRLDLPRPGVWQVMLRINDRAGTVLACELVLNRP